MAERSVPLFSIGAVARMLELSAATIRTWETRYGDIVPQRSGGGQRLYSREQVDHLRFVKDEVAAGRRPAEAHRLLQRTATALDVRVAATPHAPAEARRAIDDLAADLDEDVRFNLRLLVSELVANSIRHAGPGEIHVGATLAPGFARVEVLDGGPGFDPDDRPGEGFGLRLVDKLASRWGVEQSPRSCRVWFEVDRRRGRFQRDDA
jgi:DNA-binding transcriptional MerR regulator